MAEWLLRGKPSVLGFCSGAVAGLVVITPACGWVNANGSMIIGVLAGIIPFFAVTWLKPLFKYDDALDTFGVHAIGGTFGALMTGIFAVPAVGFYFDGATPAAGVIAGNSGQFTIQVASVAVSSMR